MRNYIADVLEGKENRVERLLLAFDMVAGGAYDDSGACPEAVYDILLDRLQEAVANLAEFEAEMTLAGLARKVIAK